MKKSILLLFLTAFFIGCSSDDSGDSNTNNNSFNPPSWILGKWTTDPMAGHSSKNLSSTELGFEFKEDDFCYITAGVTTCFKEMLSIYNGTDVNTQITEEKSDTHYKVNVTIQGTTYNYHFVKISDTQIQEIISDPDGYVPYYSTESDGGDNSPSLPISLDFTNLTLPEGTTSLVMDDITIRAGISYGELTQHTNFCDIESSNRVLHFFDSNNLPEEEYPNEHTNFPNHSGLVIDYHWAWVWDYDINDYNGVYPYNNVFFETNLPSVETITINLTTGCCLYVELCNENGVILFEDYLAVVFGEEEIIIDVGGQRVTKITVGVSDGTGRYRNVIHSLKIE